MKINSQTIRQMIHEELDNILNEQKIPTPESMGFKVPDISEAEDLLANIKQEVDLKGLLKFVSKNSPQRTLEALTPQQKRQALLRRRRKQQQQEIPQQELEPVKSKTIGEMITENVNIIRKGGAMERTGGVYMENVTKLKEAHKSAEGSDKELIEGWLKIFIYEASNPLLKKYLPGITKFSIDKYEEIQQFLKDRKDRLDKQRVEDVLNNRKYFEQQEKIRMLTIALMLGAGGYFLYGPAMAASLAVKHVLVAMAFCVIMIFPAIAASAIEIAQEKDKKKNLKAREYRKLQRMKADGNED